MSRAPSATTAIPAPDLAEASLLVILAHLEERLAAGDRELRLRVLDPDHGRGCYAGEVVRLGDRDLLHRPLQVWLELAERLGLRLLTPRGVAGGLVELRFERLDPAASWRGPAGSERYGEATPFQRITKLEDPGLVLDVRDALARIDLPADPRILGLGINRGDEFALLSALAPELTTRAHFVGVDHCASAITLARQRFPATTHRFIVGDLGDRDALEELELGPTFDLAIAFATLQSPGVADRALLRELVQRRLRATGALLLVIPNSRYVDGELVYGARTRNRRQTELGLVIKDLAFYRRYLEQHRREVFVAGKHHLVMTAIPRRVPATSIAAERR